MWVSCYPLLEFWNRLKISRTVEDRNFKFDTDTDGSEFQRRMLN